MKKLLAIKGEIHKIKNYAIDLVESCRYGRSISVGDEAVEEGATRGTTALVY